MFELFRQAFRKPKTTFEKKVARKVLSVQEISIRKINAIFSKRYDGASKEEISRIQLEAMSLGYIFTEAAAHAIASSAELEKEVFQVLQELVAADKAWEPFYPNFPAQVANADNIELFYNAVAHYWTNGVWKPNYNKSSRIPLFEKTEFKEIDLTNNEAILDSFNEILSANGSLPKKDQEVLYSLLNIYNYKQLIKYIPEAIPFKETMCQLVAFALELDQHEIANIGIKNTTDVLRVATGLSGGDISLATNTKFKLKRKHRRWMVNILEEVITESDVRRHCNKWKRLLHCLHIGTFENAPKCNAIASKLRNSKLIGPKAEIETALIDKNKSVLTSKLVGMPGEFARRLDHLLRIFPEDSAQDILKSFDSVITKVDTRVLLQMLGHFKHRVVNQDNINIHGTTKSRHTRIALPKGQIANVKVLKNEIEDISTSLLLDVINLIEKTIKDRFSKKTNLGKTWIDPELQKCPVPLQMRSASEGLKIVQRGTRLPMGDKNTLRFFVHWIGKDIDLSAAFLTENLKFHSEIAYYELRRDSKRDGYKALHSGDITYAPPPNGACEFIDIDLDSVNTDLIRYIAMDVRVYEGLPFPSQDANVGWMMRDSLGEEGEIFDARTVEQRISISATSRSCLVAIFDVIKREVIWLDLVGSSNYLKSGNNVTNNRFNIEDLLEASLNFHHISIYDLLELHASQRGELTLNKSEATTIFNRDFVYSYEKILAEFL